jgi:hypothetical protein
MPNLSPYTKVPMPQKKYRSDDDSRWVIRNVNPDVIRKVKTLAFINERTIAQQLELIVEEWFAASGIVLPAKDSDKQT